MNADQLLNLPRERLANLPTPLVPARWSCGDSKLLVKRDDLSGAGLTGNKVRKLEYLFAEAKRQGCDTVVTCGGVQSNHARATAIGAVMVGLKPVLVLTGDTPDCLDGNLLLDELVGADVRLLPPMSGQERAAAMEQIAVELRQGGAKPYAMPSGGSNEVGAMGYFRAAKELLEDIKALERPVKTVVVAVGSGGTYVGLFLGARMLGLDVNIVGATVDGTPDQWRVDLSDYFKRCIDRWELDVTFDPGEFRLLGAVGDGYAVSRPEELDFIVRFARKTGLILDPVYTGKTMYAFDKAVNGGDIEPEGDVVFIHTGGVFGLFPKREQLAGVLGR